YVVRPMRKGHGAGCYDHQHAEHPLYSVEVLLLVQLAYGLDASYGNAADGRNRHGNPGSDQVAHAAAEIEPDVLQALQYRHQGYCEGGKKNVVRDVALRFCERVLLPDNQPLNAAEYQVSDNPRSQWRDDPAHDNGADLAPLHRFHADADCRES